MAILDPRWLLFSCTSHHGTQVRSKNDSQLDRLDIVTLDMTGGNATFVIRSPS
jgi:hypothetical protein